MTDKPNTRRHDQPDEPTATTANPDTTTTTGSDTTVSEPLRLDGDEATTMMRESGGYTCIRYDTTDSHIEYRYNPQTDEFEQLCTTTDDDGEPNGIDSYRALTDAEAITFLTPPEHSPTLLPELVRFADSHFAEVNTDPSPSPGYARPEQ